MWPQAAWDKLVGRKLDTPILQEEHKTKAFETEWGEEYFGLRWRKTQMQKLDNKELCYVFNGRDK